MTLKRQDRELRPMRNLQTLLPVPTPQLKLCICSFLSHLFFHFSVATNAQQSLLDDKYPEILRLVWKDIHSPLIPLFFGCQNHLIVGPILMLSTGCWLMEFHLAQYFLVYLPTMPMLLSALAEMEEFAHSWSISLTFDVRGHSSGEAAKGTHKRRLWAVPFDGIVRFIS